MNFEELALMVEAKGTKPGERYNNTRNSEGPAGVTSSPIGKSSYNPEIPEFEQKHPKDKGLGDAVEVISLLSKAVSLLKNDDTFQDQMKGIMNGFKKNRNQISAYQESVLKTKPKIIDNAWGNINRLMKIVNDPQKKQDKDYDKWVDEYNNAVELKNAHEEELEKVYSEIDGVTDRNEELNNEYLEQMVAVIRHTTKRLFNKLSQEIQEDPKASRPMTMNELDWKALEKNLSKDSEAQLQLLEMLMSPDASKNPLITFLGLQEKHYDDAKDRYFQLRRGDNYSISTDQLYRNLPLHRFVDYFYSAILKNPVIRLTTKQSNMAKNAASGDGMMDKLGHVKNEREWEEIKPELQKYIKGLKDISKDQKNSLIGLAKGPFLTRKGAANTPFKIRSSLKSAQIAESFDNLVGSYLLSTSVDHNDFKLDMIELLSPKR